MDAFSLFFKEVDQHGCPLTHLLPHYSVCMQSQAYLQQFTVMLNQGRLDHKRALCIM
jgi:hypothetical protein